MTLSKVLATICMFTLSTNIINHVEAQMMPEYDDYPNSDPDDYPHPDGMSPPDPYGMARGAGGGGGRKNEVVIGTKRFKLYEKKRLPFKKAKEFCRKKDGKLAEAKTLDEMRRLESLFMRARMIGMDVWVGVDKKKWKKHALKEASHPGLNLDKAGMEEAGIKAMMMGGGQKEMCPAISLSTRNLAPVMCMQPLGFICEYDRNRPKTTKKPKPKGNSTTKSGKKKKDVKKRNKRKDEMK